MDNVQVKNAKTKPVEGQPKKPRSRNVRGRRPRSGPPEQAPAPPPSPDRAKDREYVCLVCTTEFRDFRGSEGLRNVMCPYCMTQGVERFLDPETGRESYKILLKDEMVNRTQKLVKGALRKITRERIDNDRRSPIKRNWENEPARPPEED